jgi:ribosomal protein S20
VAIRLAKKNKTKATILKAISLVDRAAKKKIIHKNKAAHIKSALSKK